jgi:hypothetical protein
MPAFYRIKGKKAGRRNITRFWPKAITKLPEVSRQWMRENGYSVAQIELLLPKMPRLSRTTSRMANRVLPTMSEETRKVGEVILKVGTAGGSLTLVGVRSAQGWQFQRKVYDCGLVLINEGPPISRESDWIDSWEAALKILDEHP